MITQKVDELMTAHCRILFFALKKIVSQLYVQQQVTQKETTKALDQVAALKQVTFHLAELLDWEDIIPTTKTAMKASKHTKVFDILLYPWGQKPQTRNTQVFPSHHAENLL